MEQGRTTINRLLLLEERIGAGLALALVKRVVHDGVGTASIHLLEGSVGSTTGAGNKGNDTNDDTGDDTSSEGSDDDRGGRDARIIGLDALLLVLFALDGRAIIPVGFRGGVAIEGLVVAALEGDANSSGTKEAVVRT
jgi:hypothetical protein